MCLLLPFAQQQASLVSMMSYMTWLCTMKLNKSIHGLTTYAKYSTRQLAMWCSYKSQWAICSHAIICKCSWQLEACIISGVCTKVLENICTRYSLSFHTFIPSSSFILWKQYSYTAMSSVLPSYQALWACNQLSMPFEYSDFVKCDRSKCSTFVCTPLQLLCTGNHDTLQSFSL